MSSGFAAHKFFQTIPLVVAGLLVVLTITYLISRRAGRHNVVDTAWGLLYVTVALISFLASAGSGNTGRRWLLLVMTAAWGLRLAVHIGRRGVGKGEDPRYAKMLANRGQLQTIAVVYGLQGVLALIISAPLQVGAFEAAGLTPLAYIGVLVWLVGLVFEGVGDWQMEQFKKAKATGAGAGAGAGVGAGVGVGVGVGSSVMDRGLWRFTRHPNYFGDACVWVGLFLVAAERWPGILTVFAPAIMIYLLAFGSGKRVLERSMAERAGYRDYMKRTSGFIPLPPRQG